MNVSVAMPFDSMSDNVETGVRLVLTREQADREMKFFPWEYRESTCSISQTYPSSIQVQSIKERSFRCKVKCYVDAVGTPHVAWLQERSAHIGFLRLRMGKYKGPVVLYISKTVIVDGDVRVSPVFAFPCFSSQAKKALEIDLM